MISFEELEQRCKTMNFEEKELLNFLYDYETVEANDPQETEGVVMKFVNVRRYEFEDGVTVFEVAKTVSNEYARVWHNTRDTEEELKQVYNDNLYSGEVEVATLFGSMEKVNQFIKGKYEEMKLESLIKSFT